MADVFHARVAESSRLEPTLVRSLFRRTALSLLAIGLVPALIAVLAGGPLFELMFGPEWGRAGSIAAIVAPWMLAQFVVSPLGRLVFVFGAQRTKLIFDAISLVGTAAAIIVTAGAGMELESAILVLAAVQVAAYSLYFLLLVRLVRTAATAGDGPFTEV